jgi:hypothetical protein
MCYHTPEHDVPSTELYSYDNSFYQEVLFR